LRDGDKIRVGETTILKFTFHDSLDENFQRQMYNAALRDPLTKIFNKKHLMTQLCTEVSFARRHNSPLSLVMFDLDHFKRVNDTHGHLVGDVVLTKLAERVSSLLRSEDVFARYGGEEFVIILRGIAVADAGILAERIRASVEAGPFDCDSVQVNSTVSVGVAEFHSGHEDPLALVEAADSALYAAKNAGRNRVLLHDGTLTSDSSS